jgi:secreted PhoX family phosphatase
MAGSAVGATTMDRPEWIAVNPTAPEAYCCLTNNSRRGLINEDGTVRTNAGGEPMIVNDPTRGRPTTTVRSCAGVRRAATTARRLRLGSLRHGRQPDGA